MRFVSGVIGLWIAARMLMLVPGLLGDAAVADAPAVEPSVRRQAVTTVALAARPSASMSGPPLPAGSSRRTIGTAATPAQPRVPPDGPSSRPWPGESLEERGPTETSVSGLRLAALDASPSPVGIVTAPPAAPPTTSRWSGDMYLYRRGDGETALATGGQLGGSQAGARIAYRLNAAGPARFAVAARVSSPLDDRHGAEAAAGLDWHPLPGRPLRISVERRLDVGGAARNAWSAYAAGGFWREPRPGLVIDGYAQAGVVGARRRDLFADGAVRAGARRDLGGDHMLTVGGGVWGAAQPHVERIDLGPRIALGLPLAGTHVTAAAEWRIRAAGNASPRSGLALTLASDF